MNKGHNGNRAHFEHASRNAFCPESVAYGKVEEFGNNIQIYISANEHDLHDSKAHSSLLASIISESTDNPKPVDEDIEGIINDSSTNAT
jgi:hypothetical protein